MPRNLTEIRKVVNVNIGTISAGTADEVPVFTAPYGCYIEEAYVTNGSDITADGTNYITLDLQNKGSDGSGTDSLASFDTDSNNDNVSLTGFDAHDFGDLSNNSLSKGDTITIKKTEGGSGQDIDVANVTLVIKPKAGFEGY